MESRVLTDQEMMLKILHDYGMFLLITHTFAFAMGGLVCALRHEKLRKEKARRYRKEHGIEDSDVF